MTNTNDTIKILRKTHFLPYYYHCVHGLICYKKEKQRYIDVSLKISKEKLLLRIRDDGLPFDPTQYEFDNDENYSTSGIQLISKLTDKMTYMRVLNLNNTIFEINIGRNN